MEELINVDKIIRPAYKSIVTLKPYQTLKERSTPKLDAEDKKVYKIGMHEDGDNSEDSDSDIFSTEIKKR